VIQLSELLKSRCFVSVTAYLATIVLFCWFVQASRVMEVQPPLVAARPYVLRAEKYLYSSYDPEIILMGSSLVLKPTFETDRKFEKLVVPENEDEARAFKRSYTKAEHLRHLLASRISGSFDVINIGVPACMSSDYYLILHKLMDFKKHPRLVILAVAPRDFLDNKYPDPDATSSTQLMSACSPMQKCIGHPRAVANFIKHLFPPFAWAENLLDTVTVRVISYRYAMENSSDGPGHWLGDRLRRILVRRTLVQPPSTASVCASNKAAPPPKKYVDLDVYNFCYNPANLDRLKLQFTYLERFATLASHANISVVLVDMPITVENQALIKKEALTMYKERLRELASTHSNVVLVDASRFSGCTAEDFYDSVHLNASGGHKCFECIANAISQSSSSRAKLCSLQSAPHL
jgi:hypothetical protein